MPRRAAERAPLPALLAILLLVAWPAACDSRTPAARAADWLWSQQQPDGSWRSANYAVLRSGQALTPFVLATLLGTGAMPQAHDGDAERARAFVRRSIGAGGAVGYADADLLEYPVYATALAIVVLSRSGCSDDVPRVAAMARWLASQQCGEARGFTPASPAYGAFGFGARGLPRGDPGHVDLAHTRFALQALAAAGALDADVQKRAEHLLRRMQRDDGGFFFSPVVAAANKAGRDRAGAFRAYATATADGLLALQAIGAGADDPRVIGARAWLQRNASAARIGGIDEQPSEPWHDALRFYHAMVLAEAHAGVRADLAAMLAARQQRDGSFCSELASAMKEDDPVLATALALRALSLR